MTPKELLNLIAASAKYYSREQIWHHALHHITEDREVIAEFGVFKGRSINYMAAVRPKNTFIGLDSFEGLPEDWKPGRPKGYFAVNLPLLKFEPNVKIIPGWFEDTIKQLEPYHHDLKMIHIDCDIYSGTKTILNTLKDVIIQNKCVLLFDELIGYSGYEPHEFKAFLEFIEDTGVKFTVQGRTREQVLLKIDK